MTQFTNIDPALDQALEWLSGLLVEQRPLLMVVDELRHRVLYQPADCMQQNA